MNKFSVFVKESYKELMEKVTWPKWEQLQQSTMIVLGATLFITAIVALMDFIANGSMKFIYSLFSGDFCFINVLWKHRRNSSGKY